MNRNNFLASLGIGALATLPINAKAESKVLAVFNGTDMLQPGTTK